MAPPGTVHSPPAEDVQPVRSVPLNMDTRLGSPNGPVPPPPEVTTVSESMFAAPAAAAEVSRTVLVPAASEADSEAPAHFVHEPVPGKSTRVAAPPLTVMSAGRLAEVPLAYRKVRVALPASGAVTVSSRYEP